jgi:hypothetical protein
MWFACARWRVAGRLPASIPDKTYAGPFDYELESSGAEKEQSKP